MKAAHAPPTKRDLLAFIPVAMDADAEKFRREAKKCRQQAKDCLSPPDKEAWLQLAADWMELAEEQERRRLTQYP